MARTITLCWLVSTVILAAAAALLELGWLGWGMVAVHFVVGGIVSGIVWWIERSERSVSS
jgi:hypothetical protein